MPEFLSYLLIITAAIIGTLGLVGLGYAVRNYVTKRDVQVD